MRLTANGLGRGAGVVRSVLVMVGKMPEVA